ncbi:MAG: dicarboxylate--CoA ligase PimA [Beijerinckiaceae bacterium]|nr:dicarboxylate--CoA ligase PimA [Beijerinckiaceae bacterium]
MTRSRSAGCDGAAAPRPFVWEKSYPDGRGWDTPIAISTVTAHFDESVARNGSRCALMFRDRAISYDDLGARVAKAAAAFLHLGLGKSGAEQGCIALYLPNTPYHPIAFYAALKTGARVVHLSPLDAERTLLHKLADSGARVIVTTDAGSLLPMALKLAEAGAVDTVIVGEDEAFGGAIPRSPIPDAPHVLRLSALMDEAPVVERWPPVRPEDIALLQYTGGTTGMPKGAVLTHANLTAAVAMYDAWFTIQKVGTPGEDRVIGVLPLFHIYALTTILLRQIGNGNTILLHMRFDVEAVLHDIEVRRATQFPGVPTMWIALANHHDIDKRDLSSLKQCLSGGASLPVEIAARFKQLTGLTLRGGWGMTETSPAGTRIPESCENKPGTIGIPMPGVELQVVALDDSSRALGIGEVGELRVRGPNVTSGYWNKPEETAAAFADGYLLTGDVGYMDEDGYFFIVDRKKDMIISGGYNVYPQMIEQAIYEHPAVSEVLVVGVPDAYRGEAAKAFIALRAGFEPFSIEQLRDFLSSRLGPHELPSTLEFRAALPRTPVGKLSKLDLVLELRRGQAAGPAHA